MHAAAAAAAADGDDDDDDDVCLSSVEHHPRIKSQFAARTCDK